MDSRLQIELAQTLFEWWWGRQPYDPSWEKCDPHIQAFWMDGAWRVGQHDGVRNV